MWRPLPIPRDGSRCCRYEVLAIVGTRIRILPIYHGSRWIR